MTLKDTNWKCADFCIPIYLDQQIVFDLLAILDEGFSQISMVMRRILRLERKNRVTAPIQIEKELLIAMELRGLERHNTVNIALENHLRGMNIQVEQPAAVPPVAVKA